MPDDSEIKKSKKKKEKDESYPLEITDRSGIKHILASGSSATAIFTGIADKYQDNPYNTIPET